MIVEELEPSPFALTPNNIYWFQWQSIDNSTNKLLLVKIAKNEK